MSPTRTVFLIAAALLPRVATAQATQAATASADRSRVLIASRRESPIVLDGRLDDVAWATAEVAREFKQGWPAAGQPETERTEARILFDREALYVGIRAFDSRPDSIAAQLFRRDDLSAYSDWVYVGIDSYHDRRTAFQFGVNPRGVQKDAAFSNDVSGDINWDAVWEAVTTIDSLGWSAEYRIPLSQLRFNDSRDSRNRVWGVQFMRDVARRSERTTWTSWRPEDGAWVSRFGELRGLVDVPQSRQLEVLPYVSTKIVREPIPPGQELNPFFAPTEMTPGVGADLRYGLPGGLRLAATVNPDFGQVEVDPEIVNLTAFETFLPEKRPFFLEGADVFAFGSLRRNNDYGGQTFFYTRRVGRPPQVVPSGSDIAFADVPAQTSIAAASKVTGKVGPWTVGILDAVTSRERARVAGPSGRVDSAVTVEPLTNFFAGRLKRDLRRGESFVGGMATLMNRHGASQFSDRLSRSAGFVGLDFEHRWLKGRYVTSGLSLISRVTGSSPYISALQRNSTHYFQQPHHDRTDDAATHLGGYYNALALAKTGRWFGSVLAKQVSPGYDINDVGFHGRVDYRSVSTFYGYNTSEANSWSRTRFAGVSTQSVWTFDGTSIQQSLGTSAEATFTNFYYVGISANVDLESYNDRLLRGGPLSSNPRRYSLDIYSLSDNRRAVSASPWASLTRDESGGWSAMGVVGVTVRPTPSLHVAVNPTFTRQMSTTQFVGRQADPLATATHGTRYLFADLAQTTLSLDTRISWTLTSKLGFQSYFQPFVATGEFRGFKEFVTPRALDFAMYGRDRGTITSNTDAGGALVGYTIDPDGGGAASAFDIGNPNFNSHSLRGNAVLRWEYAPGSTLYLVWQQQRAGEQSVFRFDASRDVGAIFREQPVNVLMVKVAYWLSR